MLSVIIPVYNVEKYIKQCLDSVIGQTFSDLEIIVVNDGSTDGSGLICEEYAAKDSRIKLYNKKNGGLTSAYKLGFDQVSNENVTFVDSDDWIEPTMYERMMAKMLEYKVNLVMCGHARYYNGCDAKQENIGIKEGYHEGNGEWFECMNQCCVPSARWNKIFKTDLLRDIMSKIVDNVSFFEDHLVSIPYFQKVKNYYFIDDILYHYRYTPNSMSATNNLSGEKDVSNIFKILRSYEWSDKFEKQLNSLLVRAYVDGLIANTIALGNTNEAKTQLLHLVKSKCFVDASKNCIWKCYTIKQKVQKFLIKHMPKMYFHVYHFYISCKSK